MAGERRGTLRLGANPNVRFSVASGNTESVIEWLGAERIELGLIEGPAPRSDVHIERFLEEEIVAIVPLDHEWAARGRGPVAIEALAAAPLMIRARGSGTRQVVEAALEAGMGVGMVSRWAIQNSTGLRHVDVSGLRVIRDMQFVYPQGLELDGPQGAFIRFVRDFGAELLADAL